MRTGSSPTCMARATLSSRYCVGLADWAVCPKPSQAAAFKARHSDSTLADQPDQVSCCTGICVQTSYSLPPVLASTHKTSADLAFFALTSPETDLVVLPVQSAITGLSASSRPSHEVPDHASRREQWRGVIGIGRRIWCSRVQTGS